MIKIINLGIGNVSSVQNMIKRIGFKSDIVSHGEDLNQVDKIILPGVGSFDSAMESLDDLGFRNILTKKIINDRIPILGICLGMQLFLEKSEEGSLPGLGWIKGEVKKFNFAKLNSKLKIPHMGWNYANVVKENPLFPKVINNQRFYFVHSYYVELASKDNSITSTQYGIDFVSSLAKKNIFGVQFHPEKSHQFGKKLLEKFCEI